MGVAKLAAAPAAGAGAGAAVAAPPQAEGEGGPARLQLSGRRILVVGHGPVGHDFVVKLLGMVGDGALEVTVLGEEPRMAYDRVHLTDFFATRDASKLAMVDGKWFEEHKVQCRINTRVEKINREACTVAVKDTKTGQTQELGYDACVLATGSYPFVPPLKNLNMEVVGVFVYRNIEDLEGMILYAKQSKRAAVIGGGLLGLEAAKAIYDLEQETHVLEVAPYLMPTQLDEHGGKALEKKISEMNIIVHTNAKLQSMVVKKGIFKGLRLTDPDHAEEYTLELDMLVVSAGIRPRDELARESGLAVGPRGGVVVNERMQTSDPKIFALGEVASYKGLCYGLIAPGWDQASVLAKNLEDATWGLEGRKETATPAGEPPLYTGSDLSTTLQVDPFSGLYRKLVFNDKQKLLGGLLVGNADDYFSLLGLAQKEDLGNKAPMNLFLGGGNSGESADDLSDDSIVCLCQKVTKKDIVDAVKEKDCATMADVKRCTTAGSGCGGCILSTGFVPKILKATLESVGKKTFTGISPNFPFTRRELFQIIKVKELRTYEDVVRECAREGKIGDLQKALAGDEVCKPVVASILASLWQETPVKEGLKQLQDTNDSFLGNIQRSGQYSVIPRVPGSELTAEELILMGTVAKKNTNSGARLP